MKHQTPSPIKLIFGIPLTLLTAWVWIWMLHGISNPMPTQASTSLNTPHYQQWVASQHNTKNWSNK